jgi:DNA-binding MarR family transcriptional regulator
MAAEAPELLGRKDFYRRTARTIAERCPGYEVETAEVFLGLMSAHELLTTYFSKRLGKYGLTLAGFNLLMILYSPTYRESGCPMSQLGELLLVSKANITGLIDNLERKQLVKRLDADYDRRVKLARLTSKGDKLMARIMPWHFEEVTRVAGTVPVKDRARLASMLHKFNEQVSTVLADAQQLEDSNEKAKK